MKQNDCISDELENESVVVTFEDGSNHLAFKAWLRDPPGHLQHVSKERFFRPKMSSKEIRSFLLRLGIGHRQCWWLESIIGRWQIFKLACAHSYFDSGQQHLCRQSPFHRLILFMRWTRVEWSGHLLCIQSQMKFLWAKISDQNIFMKQRLDQPCPCEEKLVTSIILLPSALLPEI